MVVTGSHRLMHMSAWESLPQPVPGTPTVFAGTSGANNNLSLPFRLDPFEVPGMDDCCQWSQHLKCSTPNTHQ